MMHQPITQIAEDIVVATSTVFRFCQRIEFKAYQTMKSVLASEIASPIHDLIQETLQETIISVAALVFILALNLIV